MLKGKGGGLMILKLPLPMGLQVVMETLLFCQAYLHCTIPVVLCFLVIVDYKSKNSCLK